MLGVDLKDWSPYCLLLPLDSPRSTIRRNGHTNVGNCVCQRARDGWKDTNRREGGGEAF